MRLRRRLIARRRLLPHRIRHHPTLRVAAVAGVLVAGVLIAQHAAGAVLAAREQWGASRSVLIARRHVDAGDVIDAAAVDEVEWPVTVVPPDAVAESPVGRTAIAAIEPGEAILATRLAPDGLHGIAALVPAGWRALAVPVGPAVVDLERGDHVDLIAGFDATSATSGDGPTIVVARDAVVIAADDQRVTVAVRELDAPRVAFAVVAGTVVPALRTP